MVRRTFASVLICFFLIGVAAFLLATPVIAQNARAGASVPAAGVCGGGAAGSPYIPVDNWAYNAVLRLYSMDYVDGMYLGMRPWTRRNVIEMLDEAEASLSPLANRREMLGFEERQAGALESMERYA